MILSIIPAKGDSLRFPRKNLRKINNVTLVAHAIRYAKKSVRRGEVVVATESDEIERIAVKEGATVMRIGKELCGDTPYSFVVDYVLKAIGPSGAHEFSHVVILQPDHPGRQREMDEVLDHVLYGGIDVLMAVQGNGYYSGSFRIYSAKALSKGLHHMRIRTIMDDCVDINTEEDLNEARLKMGAEAEYVCHGKDCHATVNSRMDKPLGWSLLHNGREFHLLCDICTQNIETCYLTVKPKVGYIVDPKTLYCTAVDIMAGPWTWERQCHFVGCVKTCRVDDMGHPERGSDCMIYTGGSYRRTDGLTYERCHYVCDEHLRTLVDMFVDARWRRDN